MPTVYSKPYKSLPDQIALLKQRGLLISNDAAAMECLHRNGYYRMSAYWYPFREIVAGQRTDTFLPNSRFEDAQALYIFDKKLKLLLLDVIERVEIAARADIALYLGSFDTFAHTNPRFFRPSFVAVNPVSGQTKHQAWINKFDVGVSRSRDAFVLHHQRKYGSRSPLPIWIAIELWDFGMLSTFYSGMDTPYCIAVANRFALPRWRLMESWLRSINYVRNVIAHHGRLWNLNLADYPTLPQPGIMPDFAPLLTLRAVNTRIYSVCCILSHFSKIINPQSLWPQELAALINTFPAMPYAAVQDMGFPSNWQSHNFWK